MLLALERIACWPVPILTCGLRGAPNDLVACRLGDGRRPSGPETTEDPIQPGRDAAADLKQ
jgi:hypothetical protein